jgi:3'(2'), 5'-bisphosphate nucleotidase
MDDSVLNQDAILAERLVSAAAQLLSVLRASALLQGAELGAAGDRVAHEFIVAALQAQRPEDGVLSEEGARDPARLAKKRVWIVDPLDGTREFSEGRSDFAVHVALSIDHVAKIGAVALPALGVSYNSATPPSLPPDPPRLILVSRTRPPAAATLAAGRLQAELLPMGSAGAKVMAVLRGEGIAYIHAGGQYEWDSAAPIAIAAAAGLHVSRLDGSPLRYNQSDPYLPDLLVARPEYAAELLEILATAPVAADLR